MYTGSLYPVVQSLGRKRPCGCGLLHRLTMNMPDLTGGGFSRAEYEMVNGSLGEIANGAGPEE